ISIGAIDFGIIIDSAIVVLENIYRRLHEATSEEHRLDLIAEAAGEAAKPVLFSTLIILVAFIPLFTMQGVPRRIFSPMSVTYGFALTGALIYALVFAPVLASYRQSIRSGHSADTRFVRWLKHHYERLLIRIMWKRRYVVPVAGIFLIASLSLFLATGGEFMPKLEEGNLWVRTTLPQDVSFDYAARLADEMRSILRSFPEVQQVVSQVGR